MVKIKIIKQAQKKIKKILINLGLACEVKIPRRSLKYLSSCYDKQGNYLFFKARMTTNPKVEQAFKNEILLTEILNNYFRTDPRIQIPTLLSSDFKSEPEWIVFEAVKSQHIFPDKLNKKHIEKVVNALLALRGLPVFSLPFEIKTKDKVKRYGFWKTSYLWYLRRIRSYLRFLKNDIDKNLAKRIIALVKSSKKVLDGPKFLSHGDFSLVNLFFTRKGLIVIDWEHTRLDLPVADLAHFYVKLLRHKKWGVSAVKEYFGKVGLSEKEKLMFRVTVVRYALKVFKDVKIYYQERKINKARRDYLMTGILECLQEATNSFEDLIKNT